MRYAVPYLRQDDLGGPHAAAVQRFVPARQWCDGQADDNPTHARGGFFRKKTSGRGKA